MKAAVVTKSGGPNVLQIKEVPKPQISENELLIRVKAIGLNFADILGRLGIYRGMPKPPFVPGMELSGIVEDVGSSVTDYEIGDRVMAYSFIGSHAEYVAVSKDRVSKLPDKMSFEEGAAFIITYMTAFHALVTLANVRKGEKLLLHSAAGGVGIAAIQLAKHCGLEILATASSDVKLSAAKSNGADHLINYTNEKFDKRVRQLTNNYGVDVVMDSVAGTFFKPSWKLLTPMGRYVLYGFADAISEKKLSLLRLVRAYLSIPRINPLSMISKNIGILCFNLSTLANRIDYFRECGLKLIDLYNQGVVKPFIGKVFDFNDISEAHAYMQSRKSIGKIVITV